MKVNFLMYGENTKAIAIPTYKVLPYLVVAHALTYATIVDV